MLRSLVLLCLAVGSWALEPAQLVSNINKSLRYSGNTVIRTPDLSYSLLLSHGNFTNGEHGRLDSLMLFGEEQFFNKTEESGATSFYIDLGLSLKQFYVLYDYNVKVLGRFDLSGRALLDASRNAGRARVTVTVGKDCQAVVQEVRLTELSKLQVSIAPRNNFNNLMAYVLNLYINYFTTLDIHIFNDLIKQGLEMQEVKQAVNNVFCYSVQSL